MDTVGMTSPQRKLVMWHKVKELKSKGLNYSQIGRELEIDRDTARKYDRMSLEDFIESQTYQRIFIHKLDPYEEFVYKSLDAHPDLSASQIHDWLMEHYPDLPDVNSKTVFNFVKHIRLKYHIPKAVEERFRSMSKLPETDYGEYAQADFGEYWMKRDDERRVKVYFFVMVMSRSRQKYVYFSRTPFTTATAIYAHELAFSYYGGKPRKIVYDQDKVFLHEENLGDLILTKSFQSFVSAEHFECVFCHKGDPQSKGKVENAVRYVKMNFLRGRTFESISKLQEGCHAWLMRTANGRPHHTTKLIPSQVFEEEREHLQPYYGTPSHPSEAMQERQVRQDNTISYCSHYYSVPSGTYHGSNTNVWIRTGEDTIQIFSKDTGKQIASHSISHIPGESVIDVRHSARVVPDRKELENYIVSYLDGDVVVVMWLKNLYDKKPRYYRDNIRAINQGLEEYDPEKLKEAFAVCLDKGVYNASEVLKLCDRMGGRMPKDLHATTIKELLPDAQSMMPEKSRINDYSEIFA